VGSRSKRLTPFDEKVRIPFPALYFLKMKIEKKILPEYFQFILEGKKTYDFRLGDCEYNPGDVLILKEWDPKTEQFTGRVLEKKITYVGKMVDYSPWTKEEFEKYGFRIISFK